LRSIPTMRPPVATAVQLPSFTQPRSPREPPFVPPIRRSWTPFEPRPDVSAVDPQPTSRSERFRHQRLSSDHRRRRPDRDVRISSSIGGNLRGGGWRRRSRVTRTLPGSLVRSQSVSTSRQPSYSPGLAAVHSRRPP
jgi:hypothetical protein